MLNFNHIHCEVGKETLELRLKMAEKKSAEEIDVINRKNKKVSDWKGKIDEWKAKMNSSDLPLEKLLAAQLKILCAHKKRDTDTLIKAVAHSCQMKAQIVINDEKEHGDRALLNLGHTFCHALESATGYSDRMLHGEGVAIGCVLAFDLSAKLKLTSQEDPVRIKKHFSEMGLMSSIMDISGVLPDADRLVELMFQDKKVVNGKLNLILTKGIGNAFIARDIDPNLIKSVINDSLYS